jgi:hypothetical protein
MHFNIYLDDVTGQQLNQLAHGGAQSRNALIRQAVSEWLARQTQSQWPEIVANFQGVAQMPPFEAGRDDLHAPSADPLA